MDEIDTYIENIYTTANWIKKESKPLLKKLRKTKQLKGKDNQRLIELTIRLNKESVLIKEILKQNKEINSGEEWKNI